MSSDTESTVVKPTPGGSRRAPVLRLDSQAEQTSAPPVSGGASNAQRNMSGGASPSALDVAGYSSNQLARGAIPPLVASALPLLNLAGRLRALAEPPELDQLRSRVIGEIKTFEREALAAQVPPERARPAHYALCATIDDVILNTAWGSYSVWSSHGMVSTFHMDVTGGERFFDLLEHLHKDPGSNSDVLTLMYHCLSIGFEGRMRIHSQGHLEVGRIREGLYRSLRRDGEEELSPEWRGVAARHRALPSSVILWTIAALSVLALIGLYYLLNTSIDRRSDLTLKALLEAPPQAPASLRRPNGSPVKPMVLDQTAEELGKRFKPDVDSGTLTITKTPLGTLVRLRNRGLFASGSAVVEPPFVALIDRIGEALHGEEVQVRVIGHTDNVPINTARYPDNFHLSEARAKAVGDILGHHIDSFQIHSEGRGALEPVASNDTNDGREQNRRTDILVVTRQAARKP